MDQSKIEQMLELLLASRYKIEAEKKADKDESMARREANKAKKAKSMARMMAGLERLNATASTWLEKTGACLEEEEPTPEETGRGGVPGSPQGSNG
jgi:hypothetical protein